MKIKQHVKNFSSKVSTSSGFNALCRFLTKKRHVVLTFHKVHSSTERITPFDTCPSVSDKVFSQIISYIKKDHEIVSLRCLCENLLSRSPLAALTFDDGWRDNYSLAFPILQKNRIPATIFVTTGKIGSSVPFWQQDLGVLFEKFAKQNDFKSGQYIRNILGIKGGTGDIHSFYSNTVLLWKYMNDDERQDLLSKAPIRNVHLDRCFLNELEIHEMSQNDIAFGSHTHNHSILPNENSEIVEKELYESKKILESIVQKEIDMLAYPNGEYSSEIIAALNRIGYKYAFTTKNSRIGVSNDSFKLPRIDADWEKLCCKSGKLLKSSFDWVIM